ncbi:MULTISPECIES: SurA N-terminal domain-containing protein [Chitinophaga]|uniref:SurA N-terminal domain-containing protein n=1 Tax=Chitinophaga TaxID=79328 RepID=UPI000DB95E38|nr:peptidylprolyl isomerase [Chitinophaga ginsengisegetis]MDR6566198.1 peptidyl-prolyl cis-trans isomerase D [Chitinophaga ginsengisegetis]MDR6645928.1 peptidyl-prolyl cis-trans isomerase D [Chitinophaga ginsengisegetis]MDR6651480.1 peptidyl-prolyl cis-trans isomerase D [Chitinophaga ginsengisegetis]
MSVIQKIRDKYAVMIVVVICLAIVSFLLQDAFFGKSSLSRRDTSVGKVNGEDLDLAEYQRRIQDAENNARQQMPNIDEQTRQYIREQVWNEFLNEQIMQAQYKTLGIDVTEAEVVDQIKGKNPNPVVVQQFTRDGQFDRNALQQAISQAGSNPQIREGLHQLESYIAKYQERLKYVTLVKQGIYYPKWLAEQQQKDNSQTATVSYVSVPYATIADSTIKVTDAELDRFIQDHKQLFKVEESRKIEYVSFDAIPSAADSAAAIQQIMAMKLELDTTKDNIAGFINRNSDIKYYDGYISRNEAKVPMKDSIVNLPVGTVFGPYYDNNLIVFAKMVDRKNMPDSVKVRHILIASGAQGGLPDSIAKKRADSLELAVKGGADFKALVNQFSDDPGSKQTGGEYELTPSSQFVPEFKDFAFDGSKGQVKVVKTQFGYHVMEILDQKNIGPAIKVAYLGKSVEASKETNNNAFSAASGFAGKSGNAAAFEKTVQQEKLNKRIADNVRPMDFVIPGIGQSRELVRWAYESKQGDVSKVFTFDDKYVVAVLTNVRKEGTAPLADVRPQVEAEVKKHKKAEQIMAKLQTPASLDAAAKATNQPVLNAEGVSFATPFIASLGFEPRVAGASFNKKWGTATVSAPIEGNAGVYVIKVDSFQPSAQPAQDIASQQAAYEQGVKSMLDQQLFEVLKKKSDVKDTRGKFF